QVLDIFGMISQIRLVASLPWAFPGWVGQGKNWPYDLPDITASYVVSWILGTKQYHDLDIDYVGIWNEKNFDSKYIKLRRHTLDKGGLEKVRIIASDNLWQPITYSVLVDGELAEALDVIGAHYPGTTSVMEARKTQKKLWSSEDYSTFNDEVGGGCWACILNQNYVNGLMTATISWNLVASYYEDLPFGRDGLMSAEEPWTVNYVVESPIWTTAHTTQFRQPGWTYLQTVGHLANGGSYVTLTDSKENLTVVIETMTHDHSVCVRPPLLPFNVTPQNVTFQLNGSFVSIVTVIACLLMIKRLLCLSKRVSFIGLDQGITGMAVEEKGDPGRHVFTLRQVVTQMPVTWAADAEQTISVIGDYTWQNLTVSCDVFMDTVKTGGVFIAARVDKGGGSVRNGSHKVTNDLVGETVLVEGHSGTRAYGWHTLSLTVEGECATGLLNVYHLWKNTVVLGPKNGWAAIGTHSFELAQFDNFAVEAKS
uniref:Galactocerebrosidase n=1 Tax=Oncorhynchus tshawytscha TaxID=74940 RepID=A0A8C8CAQ8_ONCTS